MDAMWCHSCLLDTLGRVYAKFLPKYGGSMQEFEIRAAQYDELPEVARMYRLSRDHCLSFLPKLHTPEEDLWFFFRILFLRAMN